MNEPVNAQQMEDFKDAQSRSSIGGKRFMGNSNEGKPLYYPNRKERRSNIKGNPVIKKRNNRKKNKR